MKLEKIKNEKLDNTEKTSTILHEKIENEDIHYDCSHKSCFIKFKTKRQKSMHHNKIELECKQDKNYLIRLLGKFKNTLSVLKGRHSSKCMDQSSKYQDLKESYNDLVQNKIIDPEFFFSVMGESFNKNG